MDDSSLIEIRRSAADDVNALMEFVVPFVEAKHILPRTTAEMATLARNGFVARRGDQIVGFSAVEIYSRKLAEIQCLAVSPECQGRGVGRLLVDLCVRRAFNNGVHELMAITSTERIFKECGFDYSLPNQKRALFIHPGEAHSGQPLANIRVSIDDEV